MKKIIGTIFFLNFKLKKKKLNNRPNISIFDAPFST